jgi:hypothetical protein
MDVNVWINLVRFESVERDHTQINTTPIQLNIITPQVR